LVDITQGTEMTFFPSIRNISISFSEILNTVDKRLDANFYCSDGRIARGEIAKSPFKLTNLNPNEYFVSECYYPNRFKRIYVNQECGLEFYMPSQINEVNPKPEKYISSKTEVDIEELKVKKNSLLLTRSGTIGSLTFVSDTLDGKIFSDDVIRIFFHQIEDAGYVYAFLKTKIGQDILNTNNYGAVIKHIEPSHLSEIQIPNPPNNIKKQIHELVFKSFALRDEANRLAEEAERSLIKELNLPPINQLKLEVFDNNYDITSFVIQASKFQNRFDCSFHIPLITAIEKHLEIHAEYVTSIGDKQISENIFLPGRFKRVYVNEDQGVKFIGSRQIGELNPINTKFLSISKHKKELSQLELKENMILVSRSGTIGNVKIVPKHWEDWVINEHVIRIIPESNKIAGYIYAWLQTEYGKELIKRFTFGSVVDEIDVSNIASVKIPILRNKQTQDDVNEMIIKSNGLLYSAFLLESEAMALITRNVLV